MRSRTPITAIAALSAALLLSACSTTGTSGPPSAPLSSSPATGPHTAQDVRFASLMTAHHRRAVEMADMVLGKTGVDPRITALARRIRQEQQPEIGRMNGWLTGWGAKPATSSMNRDGMGGMMSAADMTALQHAAGPEASTLFLTEMITHHSGAIAMAKTEITSGRSPEAIALARSITTSQTAQIAEMRRLLADV